MVILKAISMRIVSACRLSALGCLVCCSVAGCASSPEQEPVSVPTAPISDVLPVKKMPVDGSESLAVEEKKPHETVQSSKLSSLLAAEAAQDDASIERLAHEIIEQYSETSDASEALCVLARQAYRLHDDGRGVLWLNEAIRIDGVLQNSARLAESWLLMGKIRYRQNAYREAIAALNQALEARADLVEAWVLKAEILIRFLDMERAFDSIEAAYRLKPNQCDVRVTRADVLYGLKKYEMAIAAYEESQSCQVTERMLRNMAKIYEVHVVSPEKACATFQKLLELSPDNIEYKASRDYQCGQTS